VVQLLLRITAAPGQTDTLLQALRSVMRSVQVDAACADAHVLADVDDRSVLWYWEDWSAVDAFERHLRSERFARLLALIETSSTLPRLECRVVNEIRGLDYLASVRGVEVSGATGQMQD
jgi:quinol monooxygenase YgiN